MNKLFLYKIPLMILVLFGSFYWFRLFIGGNFECLVLGASITYIYYLLIKEVNKLRTLYLPVIFSFVISTFLLIFFIYSSSKKILNLGWELTLYFLMVVFALYLINQAIILLGSIFIKNYRKVRENA